MLRGMLGNSLGASWENGLGNRSGEMLGEHVRGSWGNMLGNRLGKNGLRKTLGTCKGKF